MQKFFKQKNKAFTLIETLVAISIFTMSILGLMSILASSISNTTYAKQKMTATYLAQEGIEYARNKRDNHFLDGSGWSNGRSGFNDLSDDEITPPVSTDPSFGGFRRTVAKSVVNQDETKVTSTVSWTQGSGNYNISFSENLFNWVE